MAIFHCPLVWPLTRFNLQPQSKRRSQPSRSSETIRQPLSLGYLADCKSAIQQTTCLRYSTGLGPACRASTSVFTLASAGQKLRCSPAAEIDAVDGGGWSLRLGVFWSLGFGIWSFPLPSAL